MTDIGSFDGEELAMERGRQEPPRSASVWRWREAGKVAKDAQPERRGMDNMQAQGSRTRIKGSLCLRTRQATVSFCQVFGVEF